ncbi:TetR family transcriptional regulator [Nocardia transvalensis]|uniref:acyl-CoA-like ligand-binding transcription factor n=1 Tax=Nocardia transvalensis TaxID=37333 RepID=UPI001894E589|nr:TetR family transcriptional regulator [Nocardia transvalensis]MBF6327368.1 TetR family transcriptional regulator [Nocardia transvalensis]
MGLRERKKERTRRTIRTEAFRLFREQGYADTTIEQIAEAADVSPSTFFRYFPSKERLVLTDDLDPVLMRALEAQPRDLTPMAAFRQAVLDTLAAIDEEELEFERQRVKLIFGEPELRGALGQETERNVAMLADMIARRAGRSPDDLEIRAFSGALVGGLHAAFEDGEFDLDRLVRVCEFLEAGMPL